MDPNVVPATPYSDGALIAISLARALLLLQPDQLQAAADELARHPLEPDGELVYGVVREVLYLQGWRRDTEYGGTARGSGDRGAASG